MTDERRVDMRAEREQLYQGLIVELREKGRALEEFEPWGMATHIAKLGPNPSLEDVAALRDWIVERLADYERRRRAAVAIRRESRMPAIISILAGLLTLAFLGMTLPGAGKDAWVFLWIVAPIVFGVSCAVITAIITAITG